MLAADMCVVCTSPERLTLLMFRRSFPGTLVLLLQLDANLVARDWRWNCKRTFEMSIGGGLADLFFIDTNPFVQKYYEQPWANFTGMLLPFLWHPQKHACICTARHAQCCHLESLAARAAHGPLEQPLLCMCVCICVQQRFHLDSQVRMG